MAMGLMDTGRGSRRFALPNGTTIGEGWVRDPQQAYNFAKAGIKPEFTGEYEGMHGEGVAGSRPGLSASAAGGGGGALAGLRSVMGGGDDAPGASLMRRLTSSPDMAARYGLISRPEDLDAQSQLLQNATRAGGGGKTNVQQELENEDIMARRTQAVMGLREAMSGREENLADVESERGFARLHKLPEASHARYHDQQDLLEKLSKQNEPARITAETNMYGTDVRAQTEQAQLKAAQENSALESLRALMGAGMKDQELEGGMFQPDQLKSIIQMLIRRSAQPGGAPGGGR